MKRKEGFRRVKDKADRKRRVRKWKRCDGMGEGGVIFSKPG